ncbi:MAG: ABC transporter permease, partial [Duodenibacillus sp.]|nr:ABC transporter permease [Duodenibacillus sp.]
GLVDLDGSAQSRQCVQDLAAIPSVRFQVFATPKEANDALRASRTYATVVVPQDWAEKTAGARSDAAVELYFNKSYYAIATTLELDLKTALSMQSLDRFARAAAAAGGGLKGGERRVKVLSVDAVPMGNMAFDYQGYLLATLIPGVLGLAAVLTMVGVYAREWRQRKLSQLVASGESITAFFAGKTLPWALLYMIYAAGYVAWFAGPAGWPPAGSVWIWAAGAMVLMLAMIGMAMMFTALAPSWLIAMSLAIGCFAPTFPYTGFSYPLDSMSAGAVALGDLLPLTWFLRLQSTQWVLASPSEHVFNMMCALSLFAIVPLAVGFLVITRQVHRRAAREAVPEPAPRALPSSWLGRFMAPVAEGVLTKDTFLIFAGAIAFYLVFYAWPYSNETITRVATAVVDLDRSPVSRDAVSRMRGLPVLSVDYVVHDEAAGQRLLATQKVAGCVTIPRNFGRELAAGRPQRLALVSDGSF